MGSEMCIRDRLKAVLVFGPGVQVNGSALVDGMSSLLGGGLPITCLLYTSDAADERSSGDLGGSRIIKKKKS